MINDDPDESNHLQKRGNGTCCCLRALIWSSPSHFSYKQFRTCLCRKGAWYRSWWCLKYQGAIFWPTCVNWTASENFSVMTDGGTELKILQNSGSIEYSFASLSDNDYRSMPHWASLFSWQRGGTVKVFFHSENLAMVVIMIMIMMIFIIIMINMILSVNIGLRSKLH